MSATASVACFVGVIPLPGIWFCYCIHGVFSLVSATASVAFRIKLGYSGGSHTFGLLLLIPGIWLCYRIRGVLLVLATASVVFRIILGYNGGSCVFGFATATWCLVFLLLLWRFV